MSNSLPSPFSGLGYSGSTEDFGLDFGFGEASAGTTFDAFGYDGTAADFGLNSQGQGAGKGGEGASQNPSDPGFNEIGESPPLKLLPVVQPPPEEENPPPVVNQPSLAPLPVVEPPPDAAPGPVLDNAVADQAAQDAQVAGDAAADRRRRVAVIRERQNPTGPRGLLTRPLVQRPRLLGQ